MCVDENSADITQTDWRKTNYTLELHTEDSTNVQTNQVHVPYIYAKKICFDRVMRVARSFWLIYLCSLQSLVFLPSDQNETTTKN